MNRFRTFLIVVLTVIVVDLLTKLIAEKYLADKVITIIPGFFDLTLVWNRGAAFGIIANAPEFVRKLILIGASTIAALATFIYAYKAKDRLSKFEFYSLALIAGGAIGNLYDRFLIGAVRDFLDFHIYEHHWPAFNIADASITIGIMAFLFNELYLKPVKRKKEKENAR